MIIFCSNVLHCNNGPMASFITYLSCMCTTIIMVTSKTTNKSQYLHDWFIMH